MYPAKHPSHQTLKAFLGVAISASNWRCVEKTLGGFVGNIIKGSLGKYGKHEEKMGNTTINAGFVGKIIGNYSIRAGENHEIPGCLLGRMIGK